MRVITQEDALRADPVTRFVECLYVRFDFDGAQATLLECERALQAAASNHSIDFEFRWCLRLVEAVSGEDDGECSGEPHIVRVVGTTDRPNRT